MKTTTNQNENTRTEKPNTVVGGDDSVAGSGGGGEMRLLRQEVEWGLIIELCVTKWGEHFNPSP